MNTGWLRSNWLAWGLGSTVALGACAPGAPTPIAPENDAVSQKPAPPRPAEPAPRPETARAGSHVSAEPAIQMPVGFVVLGPGRSVPISVSGTDAATLSLVPVRASELAQVRPIAGVHPRDVDALARLPRALRARVTTRAVAPGTETLDVFGGSTAELVLAVLSAPGVNPRAAVFQRGELSVLLKVGGESGLVWVTSTRTGRPVANADVVLRQGRSERYRGRTDRDGLLRLPAERRLRIPVVLGAEDEDVYAPLEVTATSGKHVAFASETWITGIEPWQFGLPEIYYRGQDALRGSVSAERGIYRPGERVHLLGVLRRRLVNGKLAPPLGRVSLQVTDPDGNPVHSEEPTLTEFGTFRSEVSLPVSARLGSYSVVVTKDEGELRGRFEVGEYRPVRFEVTLPPAGRADLGAGKLSLPVTATYLYGSPVSGGALSWTISAREKTDFGAWADGYAFHGARRCADYDCYRPQLVELARGEVELDAQGRARIEADGKVLAGTAFETAQALDLVVEASVQDAAGDVVTGRTTQSVFPARALVGLANDAWVVSPKQGWGVKLLVASAEGAPRAGEKVDLRLIRRRWVGYATDHAGQRRYLGRYEEDVVATRTVTSAARPLPVHFALPSGGEYRLEAALNGQSAAAAARVWAYGGDAYGNWDNHARMAMRSDRASYRVGDTARLYAEVPYEKAWGLLTLEREGVLEARVMQLDGAGTPIEVRLGEREIPNVFASLAVVPAGLGASREPAAGPPLRVGYHELPVAAEQRRLRVAVQPAATGARPRDPVPVVVRVTDVAGRPVRAEVTLWAADEGVLKLTGYTTPDPFLPAYERHSHHVRTAASLLRWVNGRDDDHSEYGGDAAPGSDASAALRSRFLSTAFFSKGIVTDATGAARVELPLPDNLTRWRVMAVAADAGERFGSGEASIATSKPLQVEPALPRFLTRGDRLDATVLVHNRTSQRGAIDVRFEVEGARLVGADTARVELDAGAQAPVRFTVQALEVGRARFWARARLGSESDGFDVSLPVHAATPWQTALVGEGRLDGPRKVALPLPPTAEPGLAELDVAIAPNILSSIGAGIDALIEYPHGCVEQTTSRLIPMVLLEEVLRSSGDARLSGGEHRRKMEHAVRHVLDHQNADGGFGLWPSSASEGFLTAYALFGLFTARDHGYAVPASSLERGVQYLARHAGHGDDMHGQFAPEEIRPFAAYVLAAARRDDRGLGTKLLEKKETLSRFGLSLLGASFAERKQPAAAELLGALGAKTRKTRHGALVADTASPDADLFGYGRDLRATAATVHALTLAGKTHEADALIAGILDERRGDGSWGTTYNNLWALYALVGYAERTRATSPGGRVVVTVGDQPVTALDFDKTSRYRSIRVAADRLPKPGETSELALSAPKGSTLRYTARLRWASRVEAHVPTDRGFSVRRFLLDARTGAPVDTPKQGQLLRVRLEVTTPEPRDQVAVIDRLPAGLEPVDTALATSVRDPSARRHFGPWVWRELHDERVTHFADSLPAGTHSAEYLVRATRRGTFVRPAPSAELMYQPDVYGQGAIETVVVE